MAFNFASVAQLDRVPVFETGGWRFESSQARFQMLKKSQIPAIIACHRPVLWVSCEALMALAAANRAISSVGRAADS